VNRRDVLRGVGAVGAGLAVGTGAVRAHDGGGSDGTVEGGADEGYGPLGVVDLPGATDAVVDGTTVYVATGDGYAVVDVADPRTPRVVARRTDLQPGGTEGPLVNIQDLAVDGDTLVVAGPAHPRRDAPAGMVVVDVADPSAPRTRGFFPTDYPVHNCDLADGRAYLTANDGRRNALVVVDVAADTPRRLGSWSVLDVDERWSQIPPARRTLHDVTVHDGVAVCAHWDAGTWLLDVSEPTGMAVVGRVAVPDPAALPTGTRPAVTPPGNHHYATLDATGTLLGVGVETFGVGVDDDGDGTDDRVVGGPSGVTLWDVSDPTTPRERATVPPPRSDDPTFGGTWTTAHNFDLADGTLYSSWYQGGVKRHDVSDPANPVEESWWLAPETASFWTARAVGTGGDGCFVATSRGVDDVPGRLYTFPDRVGNGGNRALPDATATDEGSATHAASEEATPGSNVSAPGFGLGVGLAAVGLGGWWLRRRGAE
jgi:hypothetical protein